MAAQDGNATGFPGTAACAATIPPRRRQPRLNEGRPARNAEGAPALDCSWHEEAALFNPAPPFWPNCATAKAEGPVG